MQPTPVDYATIVPLDKRDSIENVGYYGTPAWLLTLNRQQRIAAEAEGAWADIFGALISADRSLGERLMTLAPRVDVQIEEIILSAADAIRDIRGGAL